MSRRTGGRFDGIERGPVVQVRRRGACGHITVALRTPQNRTGRRACNASPRRWWREGDDQVGFGRGLFDWRIARADEYSVSRRQQAFHVPDIAFQFALGAYPECRFGQPSDRLGSAHFGPTVISSSPVWKMKLCGNHQTPKVSA